MSRVNEIESRWNNPLTGVDGYSPESATQKRDMEEIFFLISEVRRLAEENARLTKDAVHLIKTARQLEVENEVALRENLEQARLLGMGAERELKLVAERDEARALAVKLADMIEEADRHIAWESASPFIGRVFQEQVESVLQDPRLARIRGGQHETVSRQITVSQIDRA